MAMYAEREPSPALIRHGFFGILDLRLEFWTASLAEFHFAAYRGVVGVPQAAAVSVITSVNDTRN